MTLVSGTKLGPFEIQAPLGAGGMGEVYRASDTRLGREVAIKVLPESFASDADRLRRFEQEARAIAALNHPNILAVHDIGVQDGIRYIVTELLEGRSLREQLNDGALPLRKALDYAKQISDGLAAAHSRGIVHRDLKPENIFSTREGRVKILDFGLAKQGLPQGAHAEATMNGATMPDVHTEPGMVMGTVGYMSPEQVRGAPADHRSDVFALGAILYEMLSSRRAFKCDTTAETMTAILKQDPPVLTGTNAAISPGLERIVHRCLEKEPAQRFQSASDLGFALESLSGTTSTAIAPGQAPRALTWSRAAVAALVLAALLAGWVARSVINPRRANPSFHQVSYRRGTVYSARMSSDGKTVVYSAAWDGKPVQLYVASNEFPESRPLDVKQSVLLSVSSSGELAILTGAKPLDHFEFQGTLSTMPMGGGAPREILQGVTAADWAPDGQSLAVVGFVSGKYRLEYPIGKILFETAGSITQPRVSRDGKMVAFLYHPIRQDDRGGVMVVDAAAKARMLSDGWESEEGLAWGAAGDEVWFSAVKASNNLTLHATTLSGKTRDVFAGPGGTRVFDIAPDGRLLVSHNDWKYSVTASIDGTQERDLSWLDSSFSPSLSSDGKRILFSEGAVESGGFYTICLRNTDGSPVVRLGVGARVGFSPDGLWALALLEKTPPEIEVLPTGPGEVRRWVNSKIESYSAMSWIPGSQQLIFSGNEPGHSSRFYLQDAKGGAIRPITPEGFNSKVSLPVSPDGKQFVALNQNTNAWNLCQFEDGKCALLLGGEYDDYPLQWSADGKYIYVGLLYPDSSIWRIELTTGHRQLWKRVTAGDSAGVLEVFPSSITPDGKSFAVHYGRSLDQLYTVEGVN
jgi:serine/threonine protein kinase/Tol biopolymer transport system component